MLLDGYPLDLVFREMNTRLKKLFNNKLSTDHCKDESHNDLKINDNKKYSAMPYRVTETVISIIDKSECIVGYKWLNKLNRYIKIQKDKSVFMSKNNVVYKINCKNCDASYVGQTKRRLKIRVKEHVNNIKLESTRHSVITNYILELRHEFDWSNVQKEQKNRVNSQKDTELLDDAYYCLLDTIANKL